MKKLFENWNKYLNESVGVETLEELERVLSTAYEEGLRSHSPEQRTIPIGEPEQGDPSQWKSVDPDPHTEVVRTLMSVVEGYLNGLNNDGSEGDQTDQEGEESPLRIGAPKESPWDLKKRLGIGGSVHDRLGGPRHREDK